MNNEDHAERKNHRRNKLAKERRKGKEYNEEYSAYKGMKRDYQNRKQHLRDIETLEDLDEYQ